PGHDEAILWPGVLVVDRFQGRDLAFDSRQACDQRFARGERQIPRDAAGDDSVHQVAVAEESRVSPQQVFLEPPELGKTERKRDVVAEVAEVAEVVGDALELEQDAAQRKRPGRRLSPGGAFDRHRVRPGVGDRGVAGHAAGELRPLFQRHLLEAFLDAFVLVAEPLLKPQDLFADDREAEVPWLDRARVDRTDRDLVHAFALDRDERIAVRALSEAGRGVDVLAEGKRAFGPGSVPGPLARACSQMPRSAPAGIEAQNAGIAAASGVASSPSSLNALLMIQPISAAAWRYQPTR